MTHIPDLKRRSFLIGGTAAGLACGYVAVEGISLTIAALNQNNGGWDECFKGLAALLGSADGG